MPPRLLLTGELRFLARHPVSVGLAVLGIALGVAVALAVELATRGALSSFDAARARLDGGALLRIVGSGPTFPQARLPELVRIARGLGLAPTPVVTGAATWRGPGVPGTGGAAAVPVQVRGVDALTERGTGGGGLGTGGLDLGPWLAGRAALVSGDLGTGPGPAAVEGAGGTFVLTTRTPIEGSAPARLVVLDVARAQEVLGLRGRIAHLDLHARPWTADRDRPGALAGRLQARLPAGFRVRRVAEDRAALAGLTSSFRMNLRAMAWLAVVVGALLAYQLYAVLCERRLPHFGRYRLLGVTAGQLGTVLALESAVLVLAGTALGAALGAGLAGGLTEGVASTLSDAWRFEVRAAVRPDASALLTVLPAAAAAGLAMAAAARRLATVTPVRLRRRVGDDRGRAWVRVVLAAVALTPVPVLLGEPGTGFAGGLGAIGLLLVALLLLLPATARVVLRGAAGRQGARGGLLRLPLRQTQRQRRGLEQGLGALVTALAVAVGMGLMIDSFRGTLLGWLDERLAAALYVRLSGPDREAEVARVLARAEAAGRGAAGLEHIYGADAFVAGTPARIRATRHEGRVPAPPVLAGAAAPGSVLIGEPFARRLGLAVGDEVTVPSPDGPRTRVVGGIVRDFSLGPGLVQPHGDARPLPGADRALAIHFGADADASDVTTLRTELAALPGVDVRDNREIRDLSLRIFEETFAVTRVIEAVALLIAVAALVTAAVLEQRRSVGDLGLLRCVGLDRRRLLGGLAVQAGALAGLAWLVAAPLGLLIGTILVEVVNPRAFGWSLDFRFSPGRLRDALALAAAAAACAALLPAWWVLRRTPAELTAQGTDDA